MLGQYSGKSKLVFFEAAYEGSAADQRNPARMSNSLFVALQERDANQFDPFLLTSPHHPFLHTSSLFDLVRDVLVMANTSSSTLSSVLGEGSGLLELFLGGGEGSVPMRLPC